VFTAEKALTGWLKRWARETRPDHGLRDEHGEETPTDGEDRPEIQIREPVSPVGVKAVAEADRETTSHQPEKGIE
jgi:hypothetical protein